MHISSTSVKSGKSGDIWQINCHTSKSFLLTVLFCNYCGTL